MGDTFHSESEETMKVKTHYERGDFLCDMHDGFEFLPKNLTVVSHSVTTIPEGVSGLDMVRELCNRGVTNKDLYVTGPTFDGRADIGAVYSYDERRFGLVTLKVEYSDESE